eukprot:TRINITY_DN19287_c0_g2_i1.p1 TRINITY_DN19287_c0_g2~~TRINITY_DN19287_c0_g2_i1.p1  ORF type:complete len:1157 (-),score=244.32 TRINITY_DN19287_c0_g2_i1:492-3911(-)
MACWQLKLSGEWQAYGSEESALLERAFQAGKRCVTYTSRGQDYECNLLQWTQRNLKTGREREVRRVDGEAPGAQANSKFSPPERAAASASGSDAFSSHWYWGHADSQVEVPEKESLFTAGATLLLKASSHPKYYRDFARYMMCPSFLDAKARSHETPGCPFLGGTAYLRHADVQRLLREAPDAHAKGKISRANELGYLLLTGDAFPGVQRTCENGQSMSVGRATLGLGSSPEEHRAQRRWIEHLLHPSRVPDRQAWSQEVTAFLKGRRSVKVKGDIATWWQQMLWKHILQVEMSWEEADSLTDFQTAWLQSALVPFPNSVAEHLPEWVPAGKVWPMEKIIQEQARYREKIALALPKDVPLGERQHVAQGVLEMFVFAGGLSVPQTIHAAVAVLFTPDLLPSPVVVDETNVEAFVYEVTRLFPAVQGFCFWRDGERQILSLSAALRDPAAWGKDSHRFTLKDLELYRKKHVGFANPAASLPGTYDSKACPGYQLTLDVVQAFVLTVSTWQPTRACPLAYWSPSKPPQPARVPTWWQSFNLELSDWLDGDQTGEDLLKMISPVDLGRMLRKIESPTSFFDKLGKNLGKKADLSHQTKLSKMDAGTRMFYEISKAEFRELSKHVAAARLDDTPAKAHERYFGLDFASATGRIQLPVSDGLDKKLREVAIDLTHFLYKVSLDDTVEPSLLVRSIEERQAGIVLCQQIFARKGSKGPLQSLARAESYLPQAPNPFSDITSDVSQVGIARCGMGQLFLRMNRDDRLTPHGDIVCDVSALSHFDVRPAFERLGATAVFRRESAGWRLSAIDWKHGGAVVLPGSKDWEHAKWVWRCSLITYMTAVHHLMWTHWIMANSFASSVRETLNPNHPIRRLLQVLSYNTFKVNHRSAMVLFPEQGELHRMSPFKYEELMRIFKFAAESYHFQTWPQVYEEMDLPADEKAKLPIFEDGLEIWASMHKFCSGYVGVYYATDDDVRNDAELQKYWTFNCVPHYAQGLPKLSRASLVDQLTRAMFDVTALHEFVGGVVEYTTDPAGAVMQVRKGLDMSDLQQFVIINSLVASTGAPMPMLIASGEEGDEEWLPQLDLTAATAKGAEHFAAVSRLQQCFIEELKTVSGNVQKRNMSGSREHPFRRMDPILFERSVSV